MTDADLASKVMIVSLSISVFTGEKVDSTVSEEIATKHKTTRAEAGRFSKQIIGKTALEGLRKTASAARDSHYTRTLPWNDNGGRLLSVSGYLAYMEEMRGLRQAFEAGVEEFITVYPRLIQEARKRLNTMFNVDDYPPGDQLRYRFGFDVSASPLPVGKNWFLDMADDQMAGLRAHADERAAHHIQQAVKDTYRRVAEVTSKMAAKLQDPEGIFRDSLVSNVAELASLLPSLNITNDPQLAQLQASLHDLTKRSAASLRVDETFRAEAASKAQQIHAMASALL